LAAILNKPTLFSGSYTDLSNKPSLFSGAYADLSGRPTLFSGSYADLSNKPIIPVVGTSAQAWDADLDAIAALSGTTGLLKKTAANTWALDTSAYLTGISSAQVTTALGYTPYNATNPASYTTLAAVAAVGYATGGGTATGTNTGDETNATILTKLGTLAAAKGGTGLTSPGTSGYVLTSNGTGFVMSPAAGGGATGGGTDAIFVQNGQTVTTSYTIPTGQNASSVGPITVNSGAAVTVNSGSRWVVL
jgi:hypothetical protein